MRKGISPVLASVLVVLVVITMAGAFYTFSGETATQTTETAEEQQQEFVQQLSSPPRIDGVSSSEVALRNTAEEEITEDALTFFLGDVLINHTLPSPIPPGETGTVYLNDTRRAGLGGKSLRVTAGTLQDSVHVEVEPVDRLVAHYMMDEGGGVMTNDSSGNGYNGQLENQTRTCSNPPTPGCPEWVEGKYGNGILFDGETRPSEGKKSQMANLGDVDELKNLLGNKTVEAWVKPRESQRAAIFKSSNLACTGCADGWGVALTGALTPRYEHANSSGDSSGRDNVLADSSLPLDTWTHVAVTYDETTSSATFYIDGAHEGEKTLSVTNPTPFNSEEAIGAEDRVNPEWSLNGTIDEVRVYDRVLAQDELMRHPDDLYQVNSA